MSRADILRAASRSQLSVRELQSLDMELRRRTRGPEAMWTLWALLSYFGAHRYYLGDYGYATAMFLTSFLPMVGLLVLVLLVEDIDGGDTQALFWFFVFWLAASVLWSWIDAFFINRRIERLNDEAGHRVLEEILAEREA